MSADRPNPGVDLIADILADLLDLEPEQVTADTPLTAIDGWDSVNALRVLVHLERSSGAPVDYERFTAATTVADLAALVAPVPAGEGQVR